MSPENETATSASNMNISSPGDSPYSEARFANGQNKIFDEILRKRHFFRSAAGDTAAPIIVTDTEQKIIFWNAGAEALCGYSEDEALGRHFHLVLPEEKREEVSRRVAEKLQKGIAS
ncbi:MAG: PAS domain-containing protein, partial [Nitrospinota bacterium]|nr:PAS domain-containing protein [Nitrospinota bacterium]